MKDFDTDRLLDYSRTLTTNSEKHVVHHLISMYAYSSSDEEFKSYAKDYADYKYRPIVEHVLKLIYSEDKMNKTIEEMRKAKYELEKQILKLVKDFEIEYTVDVERVGLDYTRLVGDRYRVTCAVEVEVKI